MKTIIFSNTLGNIFGNDEVEFIQTMKKVLKEWNLNGFDLVYIDAPMDGYNCNIVFDNIIKGFKKIAILFKNIHLISMESEKPSLPNKNVIWFLTGGNPIIQMEIIKKNKRKSENRYGEWR